MSTARITSEAVDNVRSSGSTLQGQSAEGTRRQSVIRFASDTNSPQIAKQNRQDSEQSHNEGTPIRQSDSHINRNYHTSDTSLPEAEPQTLTAAPSRSEQTDSSETTKVEPGISWYKRIADKYGSITLENKASVARDHLALERTFLAWLRTSLSFASIGIAITQLFRLNASGAGNGSKRSLAEAYTDHTTSASVPFSPMLGHAIPAEVLQYLQHTTAHSAPVIQRPKLGPTLLDQLLLLSADGTPVGSSEFSTYGLGESTANKLKHVGKPLGATFIGISVLVLLIGFQRYFEAQHWIIQGKFPASRGGISLVTFVAFALIIASLVVVIVISPSSHET